MQALTRIKDICVRQYPEVLVNKLSKTVLLGLSTVAMALSSTAQAASTRSSSSLPRAYSAAAPKSLTRTSAPAETAESSVFGGPIFLIALFGSAAAIFGIIKAAQNDSPGG
jgi:hypothetical protein